MDLKPTIQQNKPLTTGNPVQFRRYYRTLDPLIGKPKNRLYTTTILSFLVVSLFLWYAIRPTIQTILALRREIRDNIEVNKQMEDKISSLVIAQSLYQESAPKLALITEALPKNPDVIPFIQQLRNLAQTNNASVSGIQLSQVPLDGTREGSPAGKVTSDTNDPQTLASISIDGTYEALHQILTGIITMRRLATIQAMSFTPVSDSLSGNSLTDPTIRVVFKFILPYQGEKAL